MPIAAVRDGQLRHLEAVRCQACGRLLLKIDLEAVEGVGSEVQV